MASKTHAPTPMPCNIYIVGSQCTGKTTLTKALQEHFSIRENRTWQGTEVPSPTVLNEVARGVLVKHGFVAADLTSSPTKAKAMQKLMLEAQLHAETEAGNSWFISDRSGFDPIVYAKRYAGEEAAQELLTSDTFRTLSEKMQRSLVVVCEAGADWLVDDGVRLMPTSKEDWISLHDLFCASLDIAGLPYTVLPCTVTSPQERVNFVMQKWLKREKGDVKEAEP